MTTEAWEKEFDEKFEGYWRGHAIPDEIKFFISSLLRAQREEAIEAVEKWAKGREIPLRDPSDHLPNAYQFLKGKNEAFTDLLSFLSSIKEKPLDT